ncbi:MAG: putative ski2-type helicase [Candidatus Thorarchaeota archaeon AB_25]|nr:MAG: putative ski2-type helicase [Candidatus Thorarchaeota archaeon AB_25]
MMAVADVSSKVEEIIGKAGIKPRGVQNLAIDKGLLQGKSIMVSSPTGSGKTLVGEMALLRAVTAGEKGMFLVPLRALAVQVSQILKDRYEVFGVVVGLSTGDFQNSGEDLAENDILVTTYERADSLLRRNASWINELGTVVIDEIQTLADAGRGARLESFIVRMRRQLSNLQIIALSATVGSPEKLAEWMDCELVESDDRPVSLVSKVMVVANKNRSLKKLVMTTVQGDGQSIVFNRTRREAEAQAIRLAEDVGRQFTSTEKDRLDLELKSLENINVNIPSDIRALLHDGTAYHHAGLDYQTRRLVERLFNQGLIRVISATSTLAAGMDLPARTVVLSNTKAPQNHRIFLSANRVHQMLGRAGRPGRDKVGFGIILAGSAGEADKIKNRYFDVMTDQETGKESLTPKHDSISSVLGESSSLSEQLLVILDMLSSATMEEIENGILGESFLVHSAIRNSKSPMRVLQLGEITAEAAIERHALTDTIHSARKGVLGATKIREQHEAVIGGIVTGYGGGQYTCRFSARLAQSETTEGPMCSCGRPLDEDGILCHHLVALGMTASRELGTLADYVIPLSLSETSPLALLIRLGLVEGDVDGKLKPTKLGRTVNRLYLSIPTVRELLAILPTTEDNTQLLWLLRHLVSLESGSTLDDSFEHMMAALASTDISVRQLADKIGISMGDMHGLLESSRWILHSVSIIAELGGLSKILGMSRSLLEALESRFSESGGEEE